MSLLAQTIVDDAAQLDDEVVHLRHTLHRHPEVGLHLPRTQEKVLQWLDPLGLELSLGQELSSATAVLRGGAAPTGEVGARPTVLLRADMDGLPVTEKAAVPYASQTGTTMHACGHDLHTAMLAGAATLLAERRDQLPGDVVFMFQPGEEGYDGAGHMIREGVLEAAGRTVDAAFGLHVMSALGTSGQFTSKPGPLMGASAGLYVSVRGVGGHGSAPSRAKDPVAAAAAMVTALQTMVTRHFDVFEPVVISVGVLQAGHARNVIPDEARFEATVRCFSARSQEKLRRLLPQLLHGIAAAHDVAVEVDFRDEYPVTVNTAAETEFAQSMATELFGEHSYATMAAPLSGSEDFSRVLNQVPGAFVFLSALAPGVQAEDAEFNHSPLATFDDSVLQRGVALYAQLAIGKLTQLAATQQPRTLSRTRP